MEASTITILGIKQALQISSDLSQKLIHYYFEKRKGELYATYLVEGYKDNGTEYICAVLHEKDLLRNKPNRQITRKEGFKEPSDSPQVRTYPLKQCEICFAKCACIFTLDNLEHGETHSPFALFIRFPDIIIDGLKVKIDKVDSDSDADGEADEDADSECDTPKANSEEGDDDKKVLIKKLRNREDNEDRDDERDSSKKTRVKEIHIKKDRSDSENINLYIKKEISSDERESISQSKEQDSVHKNINTPNKDDTKWKTVKSRIVKNSDLKPDSNDINENIPTSKKRKTNSSNSPTKVKRENDDDAYSVFIEVSSPVKKEKKKGSEKGSTKKSQAKTSSNEEDTKRGETTRVLMQLHTGKRKTTSSKKTTETKLKKSKLERESSDNKCDSNDSERKDVGVRKKGTDLYYENGYLVTVDKEIPITEEIIRPVINEPKEDTKKKSPFDNKKRKKFFQEEKLSRGTYNCRGYYMGSFFPSSFSLFTYPISSVIFSPFPSQPRGALWKCYTPISTTTC
ncbi:conserved Plasmodium protein, unknown function [Plasmodium ovale wallikeri]|uniref:Uncharacterized protein n=1 Tax=Plasmodium ovale wallikeri TaxID=864142 RepID=A0A1A8YY02_PLAOA|nr:conserved Plasmodium protein, unknown function [Plasmodium ovale wallikeri]SBT36408.1 conserved Plasmodium protein, unknown function [Plasmodium ovale wallikeri]